MVEKEIFFSFHPSVSSSEGIYMSFIAVKHRHVKIIVFSCGRCVRRVYERRTRRSGRTSRSATAKGRALGAALRVEKDVPEAWTLFANLKRITHACTRTDGPQSRFPIRSIYTQSTNIRLIRHLAAIRCHLHATLSTTTEDP